MEGDQSHLFLFFDVFLVALALGNMNMIALWCVYTICEIDFYYNVISVGVLLVESRLQVSGHYVVTHLNTLLYSLGGTTVNSTQITCHLEGGFF